MTWPQELVFLAVHLGLAAGRGTVRLRLEQAAEVQAGVPETARPCVRFCCRLNLDTPILTE